LEQRLGELLVNQGLISSQQLERALQNQVVHGARIGTNLVELGLVSIDNLAWALGQQHSVPVADGQAFKRITPETLRVVPVSIAARYTVLPLRHEGRELHLAMLDPHRLEIIDEVGAILDMTVIHPYAVPELRLHHLLQVHYQVPRPKRFLRTPGDEIENERRSYLKPTVTPDGQLRVTRESRPSCEVLQLVFGPSEGGETDEEEIIITAEGFEEPSSLDLLIDRLESAPDRETLIELLLQPCQPEVDLSVLFLLRDEMAVALGAWGADASREEVQALVVPISMSELMQRAFAERKPVKGDAGGDSLQQMMSSFLGRTTPHEVYLVPICLDDLVVNILCLQTSQQFGEQAGHDLARVASAATKAYRSLMPKDETMIVEVQPVETEAPPPADSAEDSVSVSLAQPLEDSFSGSLPSMSPDEVGARVAQQLMLLPRHRRRFGRYTLICRLASGGMANLYLARLGGRGGFIKDVAIKRIHEHLSENAEFIQMFVDEARIAARITHPNVVQVLELDYVDEAAFIAMEYVNGESLLELIKRAKPRPALAARIVAQAAAGLHAAHGLRDHSGEPLGVVHRDVSPQNILVGYEGAVKVVDFGVAKARDNIHTTTVGTVKGKLAYMSPEQVQSKPLDRRADLFALGIVLYETTTHRRLFKADTAQGTMVRVVKGEITPPSLIREDYPAELEAIVMKALERDPERRYQTAEEMQEALETYLSASEHLVLASAVGKLMRKVFPDRIAEKKAVQDQFQLELEAGR
jgi:serine/threonine-protein kinase